MPTPPVLLATADPALCVEMQRLAAAAGVPLEVVGDAEAVLRWWGSARAVLVGADTAADLLRGHPARRDQVVLLCTGPAPDGLFRAAVELGATAVLELPEAGPWLVELLGDLHDDDGVRGIVVGVVGGSGGAGASVLAAALAATTAGPSVLVDLDPGGPGGRRLLGLDDAAGAAWHDLTLSRGRLGARALREALPSRDGVAALGWTDHEVVPLAPDLVREVVEAARRGHRTVVVDLPRSEPETHALVGGLCEQVVLVAKPTVAGVASAARTAARLHLAARETGLVVRARRDAPVATDVSRVLGLPLWGELPDQRRLDEHLDLGLGVLHQRRGPFAGAVRDLADRISRAAG